tara:strand:+ start:826 stop:1032 length:207 start_codon:yes stop_codon:yes gene_type:complete
MGVGRAMLFGTLALVPGVLLALIGWVIIGMPEEWGTTLYLICYGPIFGCVGAGVMIGWRDGDNPDLEA